MRLSREKTVRLSHRVIDFLVESPDVDFIEDRDTIRHEIVNIFTSLLKVEEQVDADVRAKIPLAEQDWARLERIADSLSTEGFSPSAGQVASLLLSAALRSVEENPLRGRQVVLLERVRV